MGEVLPFRTTFFEKLGLFFAKSKKVKAAPENLTLCDIEEICAEMEASLKIEVPGCTPLQRLANVADGLGEIHETTDALFGLLCGYKNASTLSEDLKEIYGEVDSMLPAIEGQIDDILDLIERRILPADDQRLRAKIEALREGLLRYSQSGEGGQVTNFAESRIINA